MPGTVLHLGATVMCSHLGAATPASSSPRVFVSAMPVLTIADAFSIAGCALSSSSGPFCASGQFISGAARASAGGVPLAISTGASTCVATGSPMTVVSTQTRVSAA